MATHTAPIPAFEEYVPTAFLEALRSHPSTVAIAGVPGLQVVGGVPLAKYADLLSPAALAFTVDLYRRSLGFRHRLQPALAHRKMKRNAINRHAALLARQVTPQNLFLYYIIQKKIMEE